MLSRKSKFLRCLAVISILAFSSSALAVSNNSDALHSIQLQSAKHWAIIGAKYSTAVAVIVGVTTGSVIIPAAIVVAGSAIGGIFGWYSVSYESVS